MITGGENNKVLNSRNILKKISEYDIYRYYLGFDFSPKKCVPSPFRTETRGSFNIYFNQSGYLRHLDFGDTYYKGNCFQFVQQLYGLDYNNALKKINYDFNLGLGFDNSGSSGVDYGSIIKQFIKSEEFNRENDNQNTIQRVTIHVQVKPFTEKELEYWNRYGISVDELIRNNIYSIDKLYLNGKYIGNYNGQLRFAYHFQDENGESYFKIYQPFSENYKWISNVPVKQVLQINSLPRTSKAIIVAKSKKDKIILEKLHSDVYEVQKEGPECIPPELDSFFDEFYEDKFIFYDNDEAGMKASKEMNKLGYKWINIPNEYKELGIKDPGDLIEYFGIEDGMRLLDILIRRKLLNEG